MKHFGFVARAFLCVAVLLNGCSSGSGSSGLPAARPDATSASVVVTIPAHASSAQYVSPSTQSIEIDVAPAVGCTGCSTGTSVTANLTPSSPGCAVSGGATTCTIPLSLKQGSYIASVYTYDGPLSGGTPSGNLLSKNQSVSFAILSNTANKVLISLGGVPASIQLALSGTPAATLSGSTLTIDGAASSATIAVTAKDADGNAIVGVGAPVVTASVTGNTAFTTSASGSSVTVTTPSNGTRTPATVNVSLTAQGCPGAAGCTAQFSAAMTEFLAVADHGANAVSVYSERTQQWLTIPAGSGAWPVVFDRKGDVFVGNQTGNSVQEFAPPYTGAAIATITNGVTAPISLALDSKSNLYVADYGVATVTKYAPPYNGAPSLTISGAAAASPYSILVDSSDNLWIANDLTSSAAYYIPAPVSSSSGTTLIGAVKCEGLAQDTSGDVDFSCASTNAIVRYDMTGAFVASNGIGESFRIMTALPGSSDVGVIGSGSSGTVPIAADDFTTNTFLHINSNGSNPRGIAVDAQNTLFITDIGNGTVLSLPYPYTGTAQVVQSGLSSPITEATWP